MAQKRTGRIAQAVQQFSGSLFGFVRKKVSSNEDAEDILQEVWYQLSNLNNLADVENVGAWLYRVASNKVTDLYRKKKTESLESMAEVKGGESIDISTMLLLDEAEGPESLSYRRVVMEELMDALEELPVEQRNVFTLHEFEGVSLKDIAARTNTNLKTVISRKGYAVKHLRSRMNYLYQELTD
ncbi:MAG: sigma-70 family RNA polymerase sigma factor [Bacteroidia bacterium]|nr:sigma-70 family RNA polymerase sigma factor [Bacteroidia bacterium]